MYLRLWDDQKDEFYLNCAVEELSIAMNQYTPDGKVQTLYERATEECDKLAEERRRAEEERKRQEEEEFLLLMM